MSNEPTMDAAIAILIANIKKGLRRPGELERATGIDRTTLWRYMKRPEVVEVLKQLMKPFTQEELILLVQAELDNCAELERQTIEGSMTDAKRIQIKLQIARFRCDLLGIIPKEPAIQINNLPELAPASISFTVVPRKQVEVISPAPRQLKAAPGVVTPRHLEPAAPHDLLTPVDLEPTCSQGDDQVAAPDVLTPGHEPQILSPVSEPDHGVDERGEWTRPLGPKFPKLYKVSPKPAVESFRDRQVRLQMEENGGELILRGGPKRAEGLEDLG